MKKNILIYKLMAPVCLILMLSGCYKLQEDYNRTTHTLDPHVNTTAWGYLNTRNYLVITDTIINGTSKKLDTVIVRNIDITASYTVAAQKLTAAKPTFPAGAVVSSKVNVIKADTIFTQMLRLIRASGIDTSLYTQTTTKRTFILLHNDAIKRLSGTTKVYNDCILGSFLVNNSAGALVSGKLVVNKWSAFPQILLQNYLKLLILDGVYDHYTLTDPENIEVKTLAPESYFTTFPATVTQPGTSATLLSTQAAGSATIPAFAVNNNTKSTVKIRVLNSSPSNTSDYPIVLNSALNVRTSSILLTNGTAHVIDRCLTTNLPNVDF